MEDADWEAPLEAGKWSLQDVLCHIMLWDKYFYEEALVKIQEGLPLTAAHLTSMHSMPMRYYTPEL